MRRHQMFAALFGMLMVSAAGAEHPPVGGLSIPPSIASEHRKLLAELDLALKSGGETADAAARLKKILMPHFEREEEIALPPLGALRPCIENRMTHEMANSTRALSAVLRKELPVMLKEHQAISAAVQSLRGAAVKEGKERTASFAEELAEHAKTEEEILYPAAVLAGQCRPAE